MQGSIYYEFHYKIKHLLLFWSNKYAEVLNY